MFDTRMLRLIPQLPFEDEKNGEAMEVEEGELGEDVGVEVFEVGGLGEGASILAPSTQATTAAVCP